MAAATRQEISQKDFLLFLLSLMLNLSNSIDAECNWQFEIFQNIFEIFQNTMWIPLPEWYL